MQIPRSCGILLHPLSLGGPWPCGTMGEEARAFVDFCAHAGIGWWQVLPLGPTAYGDSPYQSPSAFAGNPYLIDPKALMDEGLLAPEEVEGYLTGFNGAESSSRASGVSTGSSTNYIDYALLFRENARLIEAAWRRFGSREGGARLAKFQQFCNAQASWLDDYALFAAIKEHEGHRPWNEWPEAFRCKDPDAIARFVSEQAERIGRIKFTQYIFWTQWQKLRQYAHERCVRIIGDIPIFAAYDSADVWAHPELFQLDAEGMPTHVAGVPPDYFTATGQLWGNPLYDWTAHAKTGYAWWKARVQHTLSLVDALRIDHFRGFEAYWAVPAGEPTAEHGRWEKGPGHALFNALKEALGELPIIAEDLGFITPEVIELRDSLGFPGMRILQFAFESQTDNNDYPHNYPQHCIAYTGTHDNDTAMGWIEHAAPQARKRALAYLHGGRRTFSWDLIRAAWSSPAMLAVAPMQDFLGLGSEARMNYPGTTGGWWRWRLPEGALSPALARKIKRLSKIYFRI